MSHGHVVWVLGDLYDDSDGALTMYGYGALGETEKSTLGLGDQLGIRAMYPSGPPPPTNDTPVVSITSPADGATFGSGATVSFVGTASDTEDGDITASLVWTSDIAGQIGTGESFSATLVDGTHAITASVTDSGGKTGSDSISIAVGTAPPTPTLDVSVTTDKASYVRRERATITAHVTDGANPVPGAAVHIQATTANGRTLTCDTSTDSEGDATCQHRVNSKRDGVGTYTVDATASKAGYESGGGSTGFEITQ